MLWDQNVDHLLLNPWCTGASAAAMGTAFIPCEESEASPQQIQGVLGATETDTIVTDIFTGRRARVLANTLSDTYEATLDHGGTAAARHRVLAQADNIAPFPLQAALMGPVKASGDASVSAVYCGQSARLVRERQPIQRIIDDIGMYLDALLK
eukprot:m.297922 g.297922  ORF g.297922 m.297922 type:complete len:153 (-) comp20088_c2_seq11:1128-1586(-)